MIRNNELVSIITPVYNNEQFIAETIESVLNQSFKNFELILVDDQSEDSSFIIAKRYAEKDARIKLYNLEINSGAAIARNFALSKSKGKYIAYLDADDIWHPKKLEKQIDFMDKNKVYFTCCDYEVLNEDGSLKNKIVSMPKIIDYKLFLRNTIIQTVGVIVDTEKIDKELLIMPMVRRGQDAATWAQILKSGINCYGQNEVLSYYRRVSTSLSSNKLKAIKRTWYWYRNIENLSFFKACFCFFGYAFNAVKKRIYI